MSQLTRGTVEWASPSNPIGLYLYQTCSQTDYNTFFSTYCKPHLIAAYCDVFTDCTWAQADFGKPNVSAAGPVSATYVPVVEAIWANHGSAL